MDRARALAILNGRMLAAYSRRTIESLHAALPLRLALHHLEPLLARNVEKEIRKDALAIGCAAESLARGVPPGREAVQQLLEATRPIDRAFLDGLTGFPVRIDVNYDEIAPIRTQRMERLLEAAYRILAAWRTEGRLRRALHAVFPRPDLERLLREMLRLYALETRALGRSVRLPALLMPVSERAAERLFSVMNEVGARLAAEVVGTVYRQRKSDARH
ncbi:MAG TPA: hypothetical protein VH881_17240 [Burkholderiales bacterium]|jgi:hypothetical protein